MQPIAVTRGEIRCLARETGVLALYRSPYGCCRAARLEAPLDLEVAEGRLRAPTGHYLVVDEQTGRAWTEEPGSFEAVYELVPERDTRPPRGSAGSSSMDS